MTQIHNVPRSKACMSCSQRARKDRSGPRQGGRPREITTAVGKHMRDARLRCPEVWLHGPPDDAGLSAEDRLWNREVRMQAVAELVGLLGPLSLAEIGEFFDVTRERIRQVEAKTLRRMEKRCALAGLEVPDEGGPTMAETMELHSSGWGGGS